eukprot:scaffold129384_cov30-Tisochrysis_lutea.AAC.2
MRPYRTRHSISGLVIGGTPRALARCWLSRPPRPPLQPFWSRGVVTLAAAALGRARCTKIRHRLAHNREQQMWAASESHARLGR